MKLVLAIAAGGALGALGRHFAVQYVSALVGTGMPYGIMVVNIVGSFVLGMLIDLFAASASVGEELRAFLLVGVLGGFTTFSAFSLDVVLLLQRGDMFKAGLYVLGSVVCSVLALFAGMALTRMIVT